MLLFLELHGDAALLGREEASLRRHGNASALVQAGENHRVIVQHVPRCKLYLDGLARCAEVLCEWLVRDSQPCVTRHAERRNAV